MNSLVKKKSLGQNFLKDEKILDKIVEAGELSSADNVLEIGPGEGVLTQKLLDKVEYVVAIEKDERIKDKNSVLQKLCNKQGLLQGHKKLRIYFDDILDINLSEVLEKNNFKEYKVIANIPYYITGRIFRLLFQQGQFPELIILLVQKEVADRICAKNGKQSILSLSVQYYADVEIIDYVSRKAFDPAPKVDSAILKIRPFRKYDREIDKKFFKLIKIGFSSPRKTLINNFKNGLKIEKEKLESIFKKVDLDLNIRAEKLTIENWEILVNFLV